MPFSKRKLRSWFISLTLIGACIFTGDLTAAEHPKFGLLYSVQEVHSLSYDCQKNPDTTLTCEFVQVTVKKKEKPDALEDKLKQAREEFHNKKNIFSEDECSGISTSLDVLMGRGRNPELEAIFAEMKDIAKKDTAKLLSAMSEFCKNRTEENWLEAARLMHDRETRTCTVTTHPYKQNFVLVRDSTTNAETWVVKQDKPEGPCGWVQLSRFEPDRTLGILSWKYIARRATTNPQGKYMDTISCKEFDEREFVYDWRSKDHTVGCDYVSFSILP